MGGESGMSTERLFGLRFGCLACRQALPNWSAARTPVQLVTGCGSFQRSSPTGGAPKGMPLNTATPGNLPGVPEIRPLAVLTGADNSFDAGDLESALWAAL